MADESAITGMVTALVPSLSRSLADKFSVFRVMHHGTHEKQLSNVFAWLLSADGTHELGDTFQRIFVNLVNEQLEDAEPLAVSGYDVVQEVDTSGPEELGKDIADIVLTSASARIVVENFETSDGHGHDYFRYLSFGTAGGRRGVVVLLCVRHERQRQSGGWEHSVVVTYADLITALARHVAGDAIWRREHPQQHSFIKELVHHFVAEPAAVSIEDRIAFITAMCETGESVRYGHRPQQTAAQEFGNLLARHAERQFEDGRSTLGEVKRALRLFAQHTLIPQLNELRPEQFTRVRTRFQGQWEWCVELERAAAPTIELQFGPAVVATLETAADPLPAPDFTKIFVKPAGVSERCTQTEVGMVEILAGLPDGDTRLRDAVLAVADGLA